MKGGGRSIEMAFAISICVSRLCSWHRNLFRKLAADEDVDESLLRLAHVPAHILGGFDNYVAVFELRERGGGLLASAARLVAPVDLLHTTVFGGNIE